LTHISEEVGTLTRSRYTLYVLTSGQKFLEFPLDYFRST